MSNTSKIFQSVPLNVPDRSGFDLSHEVIGTLPHAGTIVPVTTIECMPGDIISVGAMSQTQLKPCVTDYFGRVDVKFEAFFVAYQSVWAGWNHFISRDKNHVITSVPGWTIPTHVPTFEMHASSASDWELRFGKGTLTDYLGFNANGIASSVTTTTGPKVNMLPYLCYQRCIDDFYIDKNIQKPFFSTGIPTGSSISSSTNYAAAYLPSLRDSIDLAYLPLVTPCNGINGLPLFGLRQRLWAKDMYTTAGYTPNISATQVSVATSGTAVSSGTQTTSFTINSLRLANALQRWLDRNNIAGVDPSDAQLAHFGVRPSFCSQDRAVFLGQQSYSVICNSAAANQGQYWNVDTGQAEPFENNGIFGVSGDKVGVPGSFGKGRLVDNFHCSDFGVIMIMMSIVPHQTYSSGLAPYLAHYEMMDYPFPEFAGIGDEELPGTSVNLTHAFKLDTPSTWGTSFGYAQRYAGWKWMRDRVCGIIRDSIPGAPHGNAIESKVLQFATTANTQGSGFLEIPANYLDQVSNASNRVSGFDAFFDDYFSVKVLRELPEYSLPML